MIGTYENVNHLRTMRRRSGGVTVHAAARVSLSGRGRAAVTVITKLRVLDIRFPTSQHLDGSDAMNPDPDYSAAYCILETDRPGLSGHGLTFTIGRGTEICCAAIEALAPLVEGLDLDWIREDAGRFWRHVTGDSQLRWIGPEKGVIHLATGAIVNAVWDMLAKEAGKPLWRLIGEMEPAELVRLIDFRYITDCITPEEALALLTERAAGKAERFAVLEAGGYPAYTTSPGWLGYSDEKLERLCKQAVEDGFGHVKLKVGRDLHADIRRVRIARRVIGPDRQLLIDANQVWEVGEAIDHLKALAFADPWFIEEPTSPDDVEGHRAIRQGVAPMRVATGEMCQNRVVFKQLIMREAIDVVQIDACRLGGVNEVLAVLLMAAKYGLPVCPHAGGVGLCEYVQHLAMVDYLAFAGTMEGRVVEYVDHLHEHFVHPCVVKDGHYLPPEAPGFSIEMKPATLEAFAYGARKVAAA
jgi:L-fuconate dehydratase